MFTAAHKHSNDKLYFFDADVYWRFDLEAGKLDRGYPRQISRNWRGAPDAPDAIIEGQGDRADKVYFFKGTQYWRLDVPKGRVDAGYPKQITQHWPGVFARGVDAAFINPENNKMYFFRGRDYVRFDFAKGKADPGYPKRISQHWSGLSGPFDAVLTGTGNRAHKA